MSKIRISLLATAAVLALSGSAYAADMGVPRKAPPPAPLPAPIWNWTGFYVGGNLGVGISRDRWSGNPVDFASALSTGAFVTSSGINTVGTGKNALGSHNDVGILGGFTAGYNWQFPNSPWVVGIEGEWMFSDLEGDHGNSQSFQCAFEPFFGGCDPRFRFVGGAQERLSTKIDDLATIGVRFGIASGPEDRTLWYVKGGGAWVRDNFGQTVTANGTSLGIFSPFTDSFEGSGNVRVSQWGWFVGTGVEWGLWGNWSAKIEYEFLDFANHDFSIPIAGHFADGDPGNFTRNFTVDQQVHVVKVGLNYRFGNWGY